MTFVPIVCATAVPRTSGPARHTSSRMAAIGGVIMRPDVNEASRLPPSLNPEIRPNKRGLKKQHAVELPMGPASSFVTKGGHRVALYELTRPGVLDHFMGRQDF